MRNWSILLLGLILMVLHSYKTSSQNLFHSGLLFTAAPNPKEERTTLDLTANSLITARNKFNLEFDMAMWSRDQFGYVFRIFDKEHHNIDLVYIPESSTLAILKLVVNGLPTTINIPLAEKDLVRNNWLHLVLSFDLKHNKISVELGNRLINDDKVDLSGFRRLNICFGANHSIYYPTTDVPRMAIRNIRTSDYNNKSTHNWLLNESDGEHASDLVGNLSAKVNSPAWLINNHFFWTKKDELKLEASSGVAFDTAQNRILFVGKHKIIAYDIVNSETTIQNVVNAKPSVLKSESYYYSYSARKIFCVGTVPNEVNVYDEHTNTWGRALAGSSAIQSANSTFFLNDNADAAYSLGGYHNYRYYDFLMKYSFWEKSWRQVLLRGDRLVPRSYAAITKWGKPGEYLIFGGYGNNSGQQELGPQCLYDLYRLNTNDSTLEKKWNIENVTENFIPMGSTTVPEPTPSLYVLGFPPFLNGTYLKLYRISLEKPEYSAVSDTMHFYFDEERSKATLSYFEKTHEFFAVVKSPSGDDSTNYKIFTLNYPPVNRSKLAITFKTVLSNPGNWIIKVFWMIGALSLLFIYLLILLLRELHSAEESMEDDQKLNYLVNKKVPVRVENPDKKQVTLPYCNAIYLFGEFRIYDSEGVDISSRFPTKLRQLFLSVLLLGTEEKGITNEKLNAIHWTYHSPESAKNNRNVNIKKLRDILSTMNGVQLIHTDGAWKLKLSMEVFCDYTYLQKKMSGDFQPLTREEFEKIILVLAQGIFVADERTPWLDPFNSHFLTSLLDYLFLLTDSFEKDKNPEAICRIADLILKSDTLNEEAFKLKIEALIKLKNHNQAFFDYTYFTKGYEKMYGIPFPQSFKSFIRKEE